MGESHAAKLAEELAWLINVVASRFPDHLMKGVQLTQYESLGEIHLAFDLRKRQEQ